MQDAFLLINATQNKTSNGDNMRAMQPASSLSIIDTFRSDYNITQDVFFTSMLIINFYVVDKIAYRAKYKKDFFKQKFDSTEHSEKTMKYLKYAELFRKVNLDDVPIKRNSLNILAFILSDLDQEIVENIINNLKKEDKNKTEIEKNIKDFILLFNSHDGKFPKGPTEEIIKIQRNREDKTYFKIEFSDYSKTIKQLVKYK
jgi:hypothetical protein